MSIEDSLFASGIPDAVLNDPAVVKTRTLYDKSYLSTSANANKIINDGMILDPAGLKIKDSPMWLPQGAYDQRKVTGARTANGKYTVDVVDAEFTKDKSLRAEIHAYYLIDTRCTIEVYYDSPSGRKLGKSLTYDGLRKPTYKKIDFSVKDAQFDGKEDIVIKIKGDSPLLNRVRLSRKLIR